MPERWHFTDGSTQEIPMIDEERPPLRCRLEFHRWAKWSAPLTATVENVMFKHVGDIVIQRRHCLDCNKEDTRQVR